MYKPTGQQQQGMALFQVLLIVAIISVLLIIMSQQTQSSVARAQQMQDQLELQLALDSSAAYMDSLLISNEWLSARKDQQNPLYGINFYSHATRMPLPQRLAYAPLNYQVTLALQNEASLIDLNFSTSKLQKLLIHLGKAEPEARRLAQTVRDWVSSGGGRTLQAIAELSQLPGWQVSDVELIRPYVSVRAPIFNPAWMPDGLLPVLLSPWQADSIVSLRENNEVSAGLLQEFYPETDPLDSGVFPGESQRMWLTAEPQGLSLYREVDYRPRNPSPLRSHATYYQLKE
ncbi:hypothetical protein [Pseudidiomarina insulisalsae]|uniref:Type II secretion system protein K n=1 Tax=Pseudidiomarina insulisalsae TaxID=575789 RepID=A0A432YNM8_9GAMM|nr:hypothetical protein [Pseudidiomarina insulisalsae]RUO62601.1 hypothetical protein CWI71_03990 [Pseudidiomarina insulisalsae]